MWTARREEVEIAGTRCSSQSSIKHFFFFTSLASNVLHISPGLFADSSCNCFGETWLTSSTVGKPQS